MIMDAKYLHISYADMFDAVQSDIYSSEQNVMLDKIKHDVQEHFSEQPHRYMHIEGVARCARCLAYVYQADPFICECAGYLHDWDKYLTSEELISDVKRFQIDMGVDPSLVLPLLHGRISAKKLVGMYPQLPDAVFRAIDTHTTGESCPSLESSIVYIADLIEPNRPSYDSIERIRALVGAVDLNTLYLEAYKSTLLYLIESNKYVWPESIEIFNQLIQNNISLV